MIALQAESAHLTFLSITVCAVPNPVSLPPQARRCSGSLSAGLPIVYRRQSLIYLQGFLRVHRVADKARPRSRCVGESSADKPSYGWALSNVGVIWGPCYRLINVLHNEQVSDILVVQKHHRVAMPARDALHVSMLHTRSSFSVHQSIKVFAMSDQEKCRPTTMFGSRAWASSCQ
jgi:hypothetical protein